MLQKPRKVFVISVSAYFGLALCYVFSVIATVPYPESIRALINQPNHSLFALIVLPWAAGLFAISIKPEIFSKKYIFGHTILLIILSIILLLINADAQEKGPPHLPFQLQHPNRNALQKSVQCAETQRRNVLDDKIKPEAAISGYKKCVAANLGITESDVQRFNGTADFLARGSVVAYVDYIYTASAAMFGTLYFWYLFFLRFSRQSITPQMKDQLLLVYMFLLVWVPTRIYSIWHESFFSIPDVGHSLPVVGFAGASSLVLLLLIFRPGPIMIVVSVTQAVLSSAVGIIGIINPSYFRLLGTIFNDMNIYSFLAIELAALLTLMAIVSQYFDFFNDNENQNSL
ncbi:hypothetical protein [Candidatus Thiosymbion oneisti]|nr:hypothetical protein [Candidatus Thiosymbion oneisti]